MTQLISEAVSVQLIFDHIKNKVFPKRILWRGRFYGVTRVGLHHTFAKGKVLYHVFSVVCGELYLRLTLDTGSLHWSLEEVDCGV